MKEKRITVLMVEPGKEPRVTTLENELNALQQAVSIGADYQGLIELVEIERGVCILCNEEAKLIGLEGNRRVGNDIIAGVFYVVGENGRGELVSLTEEKLQKYHERFREPESFSDSDLAKSIIMRFFEV